MGLLEKLLQGVEVPEYGSTADAGLLALRRLINR